MAYEKPPVNNEELYGHNVITSVSPAFPPASVLATLSVVPVLALPSLWHHSTVTGASAGPEPPLTSC